MSDETARYWDALAEHFDDEPDHGLGTPSVRAAWRDLLLPLLPAPGSAVADLGCGTGSLSCLLAENGYAVSGVDVAPRMVAAARAKAATLAVDATFEVGDAADPPLPDAAFDVVLVRHVLWAMPDPSAALDRWLRLLRSSGRLVLVEGRWHTGSGLSADETRALVSRRRAHVHVERLDDEALWGGPITDERYLVVSDA